jgi:hypothetical protein
MIYTKHEDVNIKDSYYYIVRQTNYDNHFSYFQVILDEDPNRLPYLPCSDTIKELEEYSNLFFTKINPNQTLKDIIKSLMQYEDKEYAKKIISLSFDENINDVSGTRRNPNLNLFQEIINKYAFFN